MAEDKIRYRYEQKYLINYADMALLRMRFNAVMHHDSHAIGGEYKIRSLYFDDYWDTAYSEKLMGVYKRSKYRIRIYNDSDDFIALECKEKRDSYIHKTSIRLTRSETDQILAGDYKFLLKRPEHLCQNMYYQCVYRQLRPKVIVDYEREPFVCEAGDVRITFDKDVRSSKLSGSFFDPNLPFEYVLEPGKAIMEVKYTEFLPTVIKDILRCRNSEYTAVSKYVECFDHSSYTFLHDLDGV